MAGLWLCRMDPQPWVDSLSPRRRSLVRFVFVPAGLLGCVCAVYFCWRGTGAVSTIPWMPDAVGQWADSHGRLRNFPAFFLLACPVLPIFSRRVSRLWAAVALSTFGTVLELVEYFIPGRMVEWQDITWSCGGVAVAWVSFEGAHWLIERSGRNSSCHQPS
jgi:hypothetical protein